jgi:hypothetical protein
MNPEPDGRPPLSPELRRAKFAGLLDDFTQAGRLEFTYRQGR